MKMWKVFFWLIAFIFGFTLLKYPFQSTHEPADFFSMLFMGLPLISIYGYAYKVAVGSKPIAITIFMVNALTMGAVVLMILYRIIINGVNAGALAAFCVTSILCGIFLYPQFMYAFKSNNLWLENA